MQHSYQDFEQSLSEAEDEFFEQFARDYCYRRGADWGRLYRAIYTISQEKLASWSSDHAANLDLVHDLTATVMGDVFQALLVKYRKGEIHSLEHAYNYARKAAPSKAFDHRSDYEAIRLKSKRDQARWKRRHIVKSEDRIEWNQPERAPGYEHLTKRELDQIDAHLWQLPPMACVSLETPLGEDLDEDAPTTLADTLVDDALTPSEAYEHNEDKHRLAPALAALSPQDREFLLAVLEYERVGHDDAWLAAAEDTGSTNPQAYARQKRQRIRQKLGDHQL